MTISPITHEEFELFRRLMFEHAGIAMAPEKKILVASRLAKRLTHYDLTSYGAYYRLATSQSRQDEFQILVNLLTTNETYFFREPKHFQFLREELLKHWAAPTCRVWSAACSTGEEAYSLAMTLANTLSGRDWSVLGSDLSTHVLEVAQAAVYPLSRLDHMPPEYLQKHCLKGVRAQAGCFRVDNSIRQNVSFRQINLKNPLPTGLGSFDIIFLRNVLIYFSPEVKQIVVEQLTKALKSGGYFFVSHAESLYRVSKDLQIIRPSIYRKP